MSSPLTRSHLHHCAQLYVELGTGFLLCLLAAMPMSGELKPIHTADKAARYEFCAVRVRARVCVVARLASDTELCALSRAATAHTKC